MSLQVSVLPLTNPEASPLSLHFLAFILLGNTSLLAILSHWVPLDYKIVMEFLASAPLYSLVLEFPFFHVVSAIESNFGSKYPALNALLIFSPNAQLPTVHLH